MPRLFPIIFSLAVLPLACDGSQQTVEQEPDRVAQADSPSIDYRGEMRNFVISISQYAKAQNPDFAVIPQNGLQLITDDGTPEGNLAAPYLIAIDGHGQEGVHYGYEKDDVPTPKDVTDYFTKMLRLSGSKADNTALVIDYCMSEKNIEDALAKSYRSGFVPYIAMDRNLTLLPDTDDKPYKLGKKEVNRLKEAKNLLFLLNYQNFATRTELISAISKSAYDVVVMDLFFNDGSIFSPDEIASLKQRPDGGRRMVICYMSIGEAEEYRYYWRAEWENGPPSWLDSENEHWEGNYKVRYWDPEWQKQIFGGPDSYLDKILATGYDGTYMDIIDAFEYFESLRER